MTVRENLEVAAGACRRQSWLPRRQRRDATVPIEEGFVTAHLEEFRLSAVADRVPAELSPGERKRVGLARATVSRPKMLLADEPAAGLDTEESLELGAHLRGLVDDGLTILLIDHDMGLVLSVCDHIYVLDRGCLIAEGSPTDILTNERVLHAYLGDDANAGDAAHPGGSR
jgi:branched-chain amino acid transport system ATP-binding protein